MARRPGLGRGLGALIPGEENNQEGFIPSQAQGGVIQVPITQIQPNPQQPRSIMSSEALEELAVSIREHGIIQPLIVSKNPNDEKYTLVAGERRWHAAEIAGLSIVPVIERNVTEQDQLEIALVENLQRADLSPLEMAEAYRTMADNFSMTHEQIAERVGKSRTSVTNTLRLLNLPDEVKRALVDDLITEGHARALLSLPTAQGQKSALTTILNLDLNVRQTEALVKKLTGERPPSIPKPASPPEILELENQLRHFFGTKVNLNKGKKGGSLVIYYYSDEELNAIIDRILSE
ncbi:MAG: ParB/RepB/Spo0J family partition protein [Brevefilum sp.]|jgi:ParB family chromosome partitioning protein